MKKINVLIADDEKIVREGLTKYVDWEEYNMQIVATAENGEVALNLVKEMDVDLLITDIYMPVMDGMTLIKELEDMDNAPLVILISGFSDFSYAQTAIRSNIAQDYILKPLDFDQLDFLLNNISQKIMLQQSSVQFPILEEDEWKVFTRTSATAIINSQNDIIAKLEAGEIDEAIAKFERAINSCKNKNRSHNFISRYCIELALNACEIALEKVESLALLRNDPVRHISKLRTEEEVFDYVKDIMIKADQAMKKLENEKISPLVQSVLRYINNHYNNNSLSLNMIADEHNASASYLSNKFKEEVGINFIKYLNGLRVKKAKELLKDVSLKVYMVSSQVGFEDVRYFSRIFRKYTGYTPTEYQKKITQFTLTD